MASPSPSSTDPSSRSNGWWLARSRMRRWRWLWEMSVTSCRSLRWWWWWLVAVAVIMTVAVAVIMAVAVVGGCGGGCSGDCSGGTQQMNRARTISLGSTSDGAIITDTNELYSSGDHVVSHSTHPQHASTTKVPHPPPPHSTLPSAIHH